MKEYFKRKRGITLIALVITIVILLILAGIAIASLTGENGLFERARQVRQNTLDAQNAENLTLQEYEYAINDALDGLETGTGGGSGETITGVDPEVTNPAGAMPTGATVIQGNADEGIVIQDENYNEWVWVEVPRTAEVYPTAGINLNANSLTNEQCTTIYEDLTKYASAYRDSNYSDTFYSQDQAGFADANAYNEAKNNMLRSVYKYGGFWIGRYEVGDADATTSNTTRGLGMGNTDKAVIKANQIPYNYVTCRQAQELTTGLSIGGKKGSLMFGIQWDLACKFLETKGGLTQAEIKGGDGIGSTNWGNYSNSSILLSQGKYNTSPSSSTSQWSEITPGPKNGTMLLTTGASENTKKMNIYDFAGNVWEWTLEKSTTTYGPCAYRGGGYTNNGSSNPPSNRRSRSTSHRNDILGFRPALY